MKQPWRALIVPLLCLLLWACTAAPAVVRRERVPELIRVPYPELRVMHPEDA